MNNRDDIAGGEDRAIWNNNEDRVHENSQSHSLGGTSSYEAERCGSQNFDDQPLQLEGQEENQPPALEDCEESGEEEGCEDSGEENQPPALEGCEESGEEEGCEESGEEGQPPALEDGALYEEGEKKQLSEFSNQSADTSQEEGTESTQVPTGICQYLAIFVPLVLTIIMCLWHCPPNIGTCIL